MTRVAFPVAALLALFATGCASRLERSAALSVATTARGVRGAGDAPPFDRARATRLALPGASLRERPPPPAVVFVPVLVPVGAVPCDCGPVGEVGVASTAGFASYGGYLSPGGAVAPGLRPAFDPPARAAPSAAPYAASFPAGDVVSHRPGLAVGSGVFGRRD